ncbi:hypothetical protein [Kitasatospora sp. NPDC001547]|uniref:hypothetical protein n=1 Tax=Kitasatospora sp. NPDC001547 TaxID=3364015 RepID=UPI0036B4283B|nr:hypothetical protein KitaXyl93_63920 [Kitasatospora sp. Xyl93]
MTQRLRGLVLHLRSRAIPATLLVFLAAAALTWAGHRLDDPGTARAVGLIAVVLGVAAVARTLAGPDEELERGTPVRWRLVRALHVLLLGGVLFGLLAAARAAADRPTHAVPFGSLALAVSALTALTALAAALFGAHAAWAPPVGWALLMVAIGPRPTRFEQALTWLVQEPRTDTSTTVAVGLTVLGAVAYTLRGSRR